MDNGTMHGEINSYMELVEKNYVDFVTKKHGGKISLNEIESYKSFIKGIRSAVNFSEKLLEAMKAKKIVLANIASIKGRLKCFEQSVDMAERREKGEISNESKVTHEQSSR